VYVFLNKKAVQMVQLFHTHVTSNIYLHVEDCWTAEHSLCGSVLHSIVIAMLICKLSNGTWCD